MLDSLDVFRRVLWIVLGAGLGALALAFLGLIGSRLARTWAARRRARVAERYRPLVDDLLLPSSAAGARAALTAAPARHREAIGDLLLRPLRIARGEVVAPIRETAVALGREQAWREGLADRRWWVRAESARALGLIRSERAMDDLTRSLDDPHEEVRAAAVDALGLVGDPRAIPALVDALASESRQQRVRVVEALRAFGPAATPGLVEHAMAAPHERPLIAHILGQIGGADALPVLLDWMADADASLRAAAVGAAGTLGLDDRAHYFVLRALGDESADVRAMAARALARSPRAGMSRYVEPLLDDLWEVAVQAAVALKRLGVEGLEVLRRRATGEGPAARIAEQLLWEGDATRGARTRTP